MKMSLRELEKRSDESYDDHARRVAQHIGLGTKVERAVYQKCPAWGMKPGEYGAKVCDHMHGSHYRVTLTSGGQSLTFDFWNSLADKVAGKHPTVYDYLTCVASDANLPTDPDAVAEEFGEMKPSQAIAIAEWAKKLQAFFTPAELDALSLIR